MSYLSARMCIKEVDENAGRIFWSSDYWSTMSPGTAELVRDLTPFELKTERSRTWLQQIQSNSMYLLVENAYKAYPSPSSDLSNSNAVFAAAQI